MALQTQGQQALKKKPPVWKPIVIVVVVVAIIGAVVSMRSDEMPITWTSVERQTITSNISTNGKIEPIDGFQAHAPAPTTVKRIFVKEGEHVKAGQMLLELDGSDAQAQAARALAQLRSAQADLHVIKNGGTHEEVLTNRSELARAQGELQSAQNNLEVLKKLQQAGAASPAEVQDAQARVNAAQGSVNLLQQKATSRFGQSDLEKAQAAVAQAQAAYAAAEDLLAKSNIRSTVSGTVYNLPVRVGAYVNTGDLLVQVADLSHVIVRAYVDEPDLGRLAVGEPVIVTWDAFPGRTWDGNVSQVPSTVTVQGTRTVGEVPIKVNNKDGKLLPNVNVSVSILTARHQNALTVPREAVHQEDGQSYVFQVVDNTLRRKNIETSISNLTSIQITRGVPEGAIVALGSLTGKPLKDGTKVKLQK